MSTSAAFLDAVRAALGHAPDAVEPGGRLARFSTNARPGDRAGWARLFDDGQAGVYGDFRSGASGAWTARPGRALTAAERAEAAQQVAAARAEREAAQRQAWAQNGTRIEALWSRCVPLVPGDPLTLWLKRRGLAGVWPLPACLRYGPALRYWEGDRETGRYPAMVAQVTAPDGRVIALHRTYLTRDGRKADVPQPRKLTPAAGPLAGAAIPLGRPDAQGRLGVAEGIETALSAWVGSGIPTVAAVSANGLATFQWPAAAVRELLVFADHDEAGLKAAHRLRDRARAAGLHARVLAPSASNSDWNDVLRAAGREGVPV
jgi:phage/plasmid primase-like uncharacterized protein